MMSLVSRLRFVQGSCIALMAMSVLMLAGTASAAGAIDASSPQALIESSSKTLFADLDANRVKYRKDVTQLYKVVDTIFLPYVDVDFAAQQVLGKHWRTATPDQRKRFVTAFYRSLLTTYGDALVDFTGDRMKVLPFQGDASQPRASVRTEIRRSNGASVAVAYSLRKDAAGAWKVWDVVIEGISYVKSFREDFGQEIDQKGIDALLQRLESSTAKPGSKG
jgi:phospholipid transport system substrate-binding protein